MKKWIAIIVASIAVILVCFGVIFTRQQKQSVTPTKNRSGLRIQKQKTSNSKKGCAIMIILQHNFLMTSGC